MHMVRLWYDCSHKGDMRPLPAAVMPDVGTGIHVIVRLHPTVRNETLFGGKKSYWLDYLLEYITIGCK